MYIVSNFKYFSNMMRMAGQLYFHQEEWEIEESNAVRVSAFSNLMISHWGWEGTLWLTGGQSTYLYIETKDSLPPIGVARYMEFRQTVYLVAQTFTFFSLPDQVGDYSCK